MSDPDLNLGIGGGVPPALGGPSLEEDEKALKKGRGAVLVAGIVAAGLVVGGVGYFLVNEQADPYGTIGRQINGMKSEHFDGFWACALPNEPIARIRSDQDLRAAVTERATSAPSRYAQHVRQQCLVKLNEHDARLGSLIAPSDLRAQLDELARSLSELRSGWNAYLEELDHMQRYDEHTAGPQLEKIARGWYDYKVAHNALNRTIAERLEP